MNIKIKKNKLGHHALNVNNNKPQTWKHMKFKSLHFSKSQGK